MKETCVVLRTERLFVPTSENVGLGRFPGMDAFQNTIASARRQEIPKLVLESASLRTNEVDDLRRDPRTIAIAPTIPMSLIKPLEESITDGTSITENGNTWGVEAVGAHNSTFDGEGVIVAVLDTGIDPNHPAFSDVELIRHNFTSEGPDDTHGHGTHCAGTIFGNSVKGVRIGVAPGVKKAVIAKVLGQAGGSSATVAHAINWAVQKGANVISMSLGIDFPGHVRRLMETHDLRVEPATSIALEGYRANVNLFSRMSDLLEAQGEFARGVALIAASGNESKRPNYVIAVAPPAAGTGVIAVGALGQGGNGLEVAPWSNTECNISAPGVGIESAAFNGGRITMSGTSMAAPHVAGVMALWAQKELVATGSISTSNMIARTLGNATNARLADGSRMNDVGLGIVQAPRASRRRRDNCVEC